MFTLIADHPTGPFRPDAAAYRLCGTAGTPEMPRSNIRIPWLAAWARGHGELLISNYINPDPQRLVPWLLPLRRPVVSDGHLRLGYWPGNEAAKGAPLAMPARVPACELTLLDMMFDPIAGVIVEGVLHTPSAPARVGFYLEEAPERGRAILLEVDDPHGHRMEVGAWSPEGFRLLDITPPRCATVTGLILRRPHRALVGAEEYVRALPR